MNILEFLGWSLAILLVAGMTVSFVVAVWREVQTRRMHSAIIKYMEADHDLD